MTRIRIDFAAPSAQRVLYRTHPAAWALAAIAAACLAAAGGVAWLTVQQQKTFEEQLAVANARHAPVAVAPVATQKVNIPAAQATAVNTAVLQLNLPWRDLRDAVAEATPPTIALLALEPDARRRTVRITAEAKDSEGMIGYIELLKKEELFNDVALLRHETNDIDPNKPLRFQVEASWSAPARGMP